MGRKKGVKLFDEHFSRKLNLDGINLIVAAVKPVNKSQIDAGMHFLSPESARNRFMGSKAQFTEKELAYLTEFDGYNHYAVGVIERPDAERGIAIVRMVRSSDYPTMAEVAITVIDEYQKKGLGTVLLSLIILSALEKDVQTLSFTYFLQNTAIEHLLKRFGALIAGSSDSDTRQSFMDIAGLDAGLVKSHLQGKLEL